MEPPFYQGITAVARVVASGVDPHRVDADALAALYAYLNPLTGGPDGTGWPFGRGVQYGEVFAVLQQVVGVGLVEEVRLFPADPISGRRGTATDRIELAPHALVFSPQRQVAVTTGGAEPRA